MSLDGIRLIAPPSTSTLLPATPTTAPELLGNGIFAIHLHKPVDGLKARTSLV